MCVKPILSKPAEAEERLKTFIQKFEPKYQRVIRAARKMLRKQFPTATELAYDNYNFFVIGFGPTERPSDCIVSIAAAANGVGLCFIRGAGLPDPAKILLGSGKQTRFIRLTSAQVLAQPEVQKLLALAAERARTPLPTSGRGALIIRSVSAKQRPRRKSTDKAVLPALRSQKISFNVVREMALALPGVEESTLHGRPSLKVSGRLLTCPALHKSAEPNSLAVRVDFKERRALLATQPDVYYVTDHYINYPAVLVRLSRIRRDALRDLLDIAWRFVSSKGNRVTKRLTRPCPRTPR